MFGTQLGEGEIEPLSSSGQWFPGAPVQLDDGGGSKAGLFSLTAPDPKRAKTSLWK